MNSTKVTLLELETLKWQLQRDNKAPNSRSLRQVDRLIRRCQTQQRRQQRDIDEFPINAAERADLVRALDDAEGAFRPIEPPPRTPPRQIARGDLMEPPPLRRSETYTARGQRIPPPPRPRGPAGTSFWRSVTRNFADIADNMSDTDDEIENVEVVDLTNGDQYPE